MAVLVIVTIVSIEVGTLFAQLFKKAHLLVLQYLIG